MKATALLWLRKLWTFIRHGWPIVSEYVEHSLDGDGMTRVEWHHAIDVWCDKRGMP